MCTAREVGLGVGHRRGTLHFPLRRPSVRPKGRCKRPSRSPRSPERVARSARVARKGQGAAPSLEWLGGRTRRPGKRRDRPEDDGRAPAGPERSEESGGWVSAWRVSSSECGSGVGAAPSLATESQGHPRRWTGPDVTLETGEFGARRRARTSRRPGREVACELGWEEPAIETTRLARCHAAVRAERGEERVRMPETIGTE